MHLELIPENLGVRWEYTLDGMPVYHLASCCYASSAVVLSFEEWKAMPPLQVTERHKGHTSFAVTDSRGF